MCSKVKMGSKYMGSDVKCWILNGSMPVKTVIAMFAVNNPNAREESLEKIWKPKGYRFVQTDEKITSFSERNKTIPLSSRLDLVSILVNSRLPILKIVTRDDGLTYYEKHGKYPPFVDERIAKLEHSLHHRWPLYRRRFEVQPEEKFKYNKEFMVKNVFTGKIIKDNIMARSANHALAQVAYDMAHGSSKKNIALSYYKLSENGIAVLKPNENQTELFK